jgi:hypothetical protein
VTLERIEKIVPLSLIFLCILSIVLRVWGILPPIIALGEFEISRTILIDAGIGGLLTVFAIVISLTLMGIQFASQAYTHRVMYTYLRSFMLWSMMGAYLITVLYNLYITAFIKLPINTLFADVSIILQTLCLVLLVPHFVISIFHLNPEYTIKGVLNSVSRDYLNSIKTYLTTERNRVPQKIDRLLPVIEILEKSIGRGDRATVRVGLDDLLTCYFRFVNKENEAWLAKYFLDYFLRLGREAVIEADDDSIVQVLEVLGEIGYRTENTEVVSLAVNNLRTIGSTAVKNEYDAAVEQMIDSMQRIVEKTPYPDVAERILNSFGEIGAQLFTLDKRILIAYLTRRMSEISVVLKEKKDFSGLKKWAIIIEDFGKIAVGREMRNVIRDVVQSLYQAGKNVARVQSDVSDAIIESLVHIERQLPKTDRELCSEINSARQEMEQELKRQGTVEAKEPGIKTSDL